MQERGYEKIFTEVKTNWFLKFVLMCKGALTIGLGFDSGDSKDVSVR